MISRPLQPEGLEKLPPEWIGYFLCINSYSDYLEGYAQGIREAKELFAELKGVNREVHDE